MKWRSQLASQHDRESFVVQVLRIADFVAQIDKQLVCIDGLRPLEQRFDTSHLWY